MKGHLHCILRGGRNGYNTGAGASKLEGLSKGAGMSRLEEKRVSERSSETQCEGHLDCLSLKEWRAFRLSVPEAMEGIYIVCP